MSTGKLKPGSWVALISLIAIGLLLRGFSAADTPLWEDEAESSINAQTILLHGIPTDRFLDEPIFENILMRPWPGHEEYEFKDLSYSDKGVVVYHGWLPLYSIAGSMALFGQEPDTRPDTLKPVHQADTLMRRTVVPRLPAILFSIVFMLVMFRLARELAGPAAGWAALVYAAVAKKNVYYGSQARYYSLTITLIAGCGWSLWRLIRRGAWRDYMVASIMWVLLFHTHLSSCLGMCIVALITLPWHKRSEHVWKKRFTAFGIVLCGTLPWVLLTGFLHSTESIPPAWQMDGFWQALISYIMQRPVELVLFFTGIIAASLVWCFADRMPPRVVEAFGVNRGAFALVSIWAGVMYLCYAFCMPAASFFLTRLSLMIAVPCILLASMIVGGIALLINKRWASVIAPIIVLFLLAGSGRLIDTDTLNTNRQPYEHVETVIQHLNEADLPTDARIYGTPNYQLVLTYYTGLPIQSVAPIRKPYLDSYPGPIVIFDKAIFAYPPQAEEVKRLAADAGIELSDAQANDWVSRIQSRLYREELAPHVASVLPSIEPIPDYLKPLFDRQEQSLQAVRDMLSWRIGSSLIFKGHPIRTPTQWWQTFQYRFVGLEERTADNVNYADRVRSADVVVLPRGKCFVYHCPALGKSE